MFRDPTLVNFTLNSPQPLRHVLTARKPLPMSQFPSKARATVILMSRERNTIAGAPYSDAAKMMTWQNTYSGAAGAGWIINIVPGTKMVMSAQAQFQKAFKTLSDILTATK